MERFKKEKEDDMQAFLKARGEKTMRKLDETLTELEKTLLDDVRMIEPKDRVSLYAKLMSYVMPKAVPNRGKTKDEQDSMREHLKVFDNVLANLATQA